MRPPTRYCSSRNTPTAKGLAAFRKAGGRIVDSVDVTTDLVIDGVVGISGSGPLRPDAAEIFAAVDAQGIPVVAVDIPSGVDVATGAISGPAVHAALTVTFGGLKPAHALADCGRVQLVDIGLDLPDTDIVGFDAADVGGALAGAGAARRQVHPGRHRCDGRLVDLSGRRGVVHRRGRGGDIGNGSLLRQRRTARCSPTGPR